ncbi:hypothetical protein DYI41_20575 [Marinobacter salarius]|nr:hypothetical protein [Marinobacter salarius]
MKRCLISLCVFVLVVITAYQLLGEAAVHYEMYSTGAATRAELADDFGLGILGLFVVLPGSFLAGVICSWLTWRKLRLKE